MRRPREPRPVRMLLVNMYVGSRPALIVPWLYALCLTLRIDVVLLQECTDRHAERLRKRRRWLLVREGATEAILVRKRLASRPEVIHDVSGSWPRTERPGIHPARAVPLVTVRGWLRVASVHAPPGWINGPVEHRRAGSQYLAGLGRILDGMLGRPLAFAGDVNALPEHPAISRWRHARGLTAWGEGIDHTMTRGCRVTRTRRLRRGPGMDHDPRLVVVER